MKTSVVLILSLVALGCATATAPTPDAQPAARDVLPEIEHERIGYHVDRWTGEKRAEFAGYLANKARYESMIREKLRRRGMPEDLLYLAMIESGFNVDAHSTADAIGIWQLVPDTARRYGLTVNDTIDDRRDPAKATDAALSYLSYLYNRFGSWYLAAAAYNTGENRIGRLMTEATGSEKGTDADYYRIWDQLPGETRDFVPAMIAAARIGRDPSKYGF
jgi:membrane-bound lytic murein transglycosylase D